MGCLLSLLIGSARAQAAPPATDTARPKHYIHTERMPVFPVLAPGDSAVPSNQRFMRFLNADVHFPPKALRDGVSGRALFSFTLNAQGQAQDIKLMKGLREDVDAEVLRNAHHLNAILRKPGIQNGRPVTVSFPVPISFNSNSKRPSRPLGDSLNTGPYQHQPVLSPSGRYSSTDAAKLATDVTQRMDWLPGKGLS